MSEKKKPFYKKWWGILIIGILVIGALANMPKSDADETNNENNDNENVVAENNETENEPENEPEIITKEINEELPFAEFTITINKLEVEDNKATLTLRWINQSDYDKAHFTMLAGLDIKQDDEILKPINDDDLLKQRKVGIEDRIKLKYELDSDYPLEITVIPMNDYGEDSKTITIDWE